MKRHNILLFTYIAFTIICFVVRLFTEFETWDIVVIAVAISSAFLTYADFFALYANAYSEFCEIDKKLVTNIGISNNEERQIISDLRSKLFELKQRGEEISELEQSFDKAAESYQVVDEISNDINNQIDIDGKKQKSFTFRAKVLTFLAFLSFLCMLTFTDIAQRINSTEDIITVASFIVVLSSQFMNSVFEERIKDKRSKYDKVVASHNAAREQLFITREKFNIYYEKVKDYAD